MRAKKQFTPSCLTLAFARTSPFALCSSVPRVIMALPSRARERARKGGENVDVWGMCLECLWIVNRETAIMTMTMTEWAMNLFFFFPFFLLLQQTRRSGRRIEGKHGSHSSNAVVFLSHRMPRHSLMCVKVQLSLTSGSAIEITARIGVEAGSRRLSGRQQKSPAPFFLSVCSREEMADAHAEPVHCLLRAMIAVATESPSPFPPFRLNSRYCSMTRSSTRCVCPACHCVFCAPAQRNHDPAAKLIRQREVCKRNQNSRRIRRRQQEQESETSGKRGQ